MRKVAYILFTCLLSAIASSPCSAATSVSPQSLENQEGATESGEWPPASRGMSVYARSLFDAGGAPRVRITSLNLRPDGRHPVGARFGFDHLKLSFALTPRDPSRFSPEFDANIAGASTTPVTVFDGPWTAEVVHPDPPGDDTRPFDFKIPLATPFAFNPADGHLLVDWRFGSPLPDQASFDRDDPSADQTSQWAAGVNPMTAAVTLSVVTQFDFVVIPEPSTAVLAGTAVVGLVRRRRVRR